VPAPDARTAAQTRRTCGARAPTGPSEARLSATQRRSVARIRGEKSSGWIKERRRGVTRAGTRFATRRTELAARSLSDRMKLARRQ
jgi:hypothetical protein